MRRGFGNGQRCNRVEMSRGQGMGRGSGMNRGQRQCGSFNRGSGARPGMRRMDTCRQGSSTGEGRGICINPNYGEVDEESLTNHKQFLEEQINKIDEELENL